MASQGFSVKQVTFFFLSDIYGSSYFLFHALSRPSKIMMNNKGDSDQSCLGSDFYKIA